MEKIKIGKIVNVVGLKGEVKVYNYSDSAEIYETTGSVYVGDRLIRIEKVRLQKNMVVLKLEGISDRNGAEAVRGKDIFITEDDLPDLPRGQYYVRDLIGMDVTDEKDGLIGSVTDVLQNTAQDIFEVGLPNGKRIMIPNVDEFVLDIAPEKGEIRVRLIEGMMDLQQ